jgi:U3 small nucleolar RNA-associated protein MPP10
MEDASLETKTWQLIGETTATTRPENSLLEEHLMFDHIAKIRKFVKLETFYIVITCHVFV